MVSVFDIGVSDFSGNGSAVLMPSEGRIRMVAGGACELTLTQPIADLSDVAIGERWRHLVPGAIIKAPVPRETIENAFIGVDVDVYTTTRSTPMRDGTSEPTTITYPAWNPDNFYAVGDCVTYTYADKNYKCIYFDETNPQKNVAPSNSGWWTEITRRTSGSPVIVQLSAGEELYFIMDAGSGWYKMSTPMGIEGYVKSAHLSYSRHMTPQESDDRVITDQLFRIKSVTVDTRALTVDVYAEHVSYDLAAILVKDVQCSQVSPSMAIMRIMDGLMMQYQGSVSTNLTSADTGTYTGQINGKNGIYCLLDPEKGIVPTFQARFARDNWDMFILKKTNRDLGVTMRYGNNVKGISWQRSSENLVTRVVPVAKAKNGKDLYLPELYVDSPLISSYPVIRMERLAVAGQVGKDDGTGTGTKWTESALYDEMRTKAGERFSVDHADQVYVELSIDFEQLGDTVEFAFLKGKQEILLYDVVHAVDERIGLTQALTVTEMEYDIIREKITAIKVASATDYAIQKVAGYNLSNNSIGSEKLTEQAITEIANLLT